MQEARMIISPSAQRVLKVVHLMTVSFWIGGCVALMALVFTSRHALSGSELYGVLRSMNVVTLVVAVYLGAYGSFFTGLAYSICTNRGFVRHKWVILKWSMTILIMALGAVYMGPTKITMMDLVREYGLRAREMPEYRSALSTISWLYVLQFGLFLLCTVLSVYKPWEREELAQRYRYVRPPGDGEPPEDLTDGPL